MKVQPEMTTEVMLGYLLFNSKPSKHHFMSHLTVNTQATVP